MLYLITLDLNITLLSLFLWVPQQGCYTLLMFYWHPMGQWFAASVAILALSMTFVKHRPLVSWPLVWVTALFYLQRKMYLQNNLYQRKDCYIHCVTYVWLLHLHFFCFFVVTGIQIIWHISLDFVRIKTIWHVGFVFAWVTFIWLYLWVHVCLFLISTVCYMFGLWVKHLAMCFVAYCLTHNHSN